MPKCYAFKYGSPIQLEIINNILRYFQMGDKFRTTVQEGHKAKTPPWGLFGQPSVEEARELHSSESPSPGMPSPRTADNGENKENQDVSSMEQSQTPVGITSAMVGFVMEQQNRQPFESIYGTLSIFMIKNINHINVINIRAGQVLMIYMDKAL